MILMRQRFVTGNKNNYIRNIIISIFIFVAIFALFTSGISAASSRTGEEERETLEAALTRSITHCYAIEGQYPESLEYLKENYGLTYNEASFYIDYQPLGSDIMPDVTIINRKGDSRE